jgi:hypothetical protein
MTGPEVQIKVGGHGLPDAGRDHFNAAAGIDQRMGLR